MNDSTIEIRQAVEVEAFQCLLATEVRAAHAGVELAMIAPCDLVLNEQRQEIGIGELTVDGFTVACFERVQDARQSQLLKGRREFGNWIRVQWIRRVWVSRQKRPPWV